jgi:hypothetical protein
MSKRKLLIFIGVVLFSQPVLLPAFPMDSSEPHYFKDLSENILGNLLILIFFYINYTYLIPRLLFQKKYLQYGFLVSWDSWLFASALDAFRISCSARFCTAALPSENP